MIRMNVGVFGLGSMGYGMAISLLRAGHSVWGFDTVATQVDKFVSEGGFSDDIAAAVPGLDVVVIVVLNAAQTESVLFGNNGIAAYMKSASTVISCATVAPVFARCMAAQCKASELFYLDAPISGGAIKAAAGKLSVMASGEPAAFSGARMALDAIAETVFELGDEAGAGSAMKAVNQLLAGVHIAAMAEAMTFGIAQGIEADVIVDVISKCAGTSWMFENRAPHVVVGDYTPRSSVDIWPKDLGIVLAIAKDSKLSAPLTSAALQQFVAASDAGLGGEDDAAVTKIYAQNANINLPGVQ
jgi:putative dehydrogenase